MSERARPRATPTGSCYPFKVKAPDVVSNKRRRTCSPRCCAASGNIAAGCRAATADDAATAIQHGHLPRISGSMRARQDCLATACSSGSGIEPDKDAASHQSSPIHSPEAKQIRPLYLSPTSPVLKSASPIRSRWPVAPWNFPVPPVIDTGYVTTANSPGATGNAVN